MVDIEVPYKPWEMKTEKLQLMMLFYNLQNR